MQKHESSKSIVNVHKNDETLKKIIADPLFSEVAKIGNKCELANFIARLEVDYSTNPKSWISDSVHEYLYNVTASFAALKPLHRAIGQEYNPECATWQTIAILLLAGKYFHGDTGE